MAYESHISGYRRGSKQQRNIHTGRYIHIKIERDWVTVNIINSR